MEGVIEIDLTETSRNMKEEFTHQGPSREGTFCLIYNMHSWWR